MSASEYAKKIWVPEGDIPGIVIKTSDIDRVRTPQGPQYQANIVINQELATPGYRILIWNLSGQWAVVWLGYEVSTHRWSITPVPMASGQFVVAWVDPPTGVGSTQFQHECMRARDLLKQDVDDRY